MSEPGAETRWRWVLFGEGGPRRLVRSLVLLAVGLGVIAMSVADLREALRWRPLELTCEEWLAEPLEARWVSLSGCRLDLASAASRTWRGWFSASDGGQGGALTLELFVPISASDERETPPRVVVATSDKELLTVVDALARVQPSEVDAFIDAHRATLEEKLKPPKLVGYVEPVASLASRTALKSMMAEGAVVLEQGREPPRANAFFGLFVGLVIMGVVLFPFVQRFREPPDD